MDAPKKTELVPHNERGHAVAKLMEHELVMPEIARACSKWPNLSPEYVVRVALNELRDNESLSEAAMNDPKGFIGGVYESASLGLVIGKTRGQCWLIPRKGRVNFQMGWKGWKTLWYRSSRARDIQVDTVHEGDRFFYRLGTSPEIDHEPTVSGNRGDPTHYYACARTVDGGLFPKVWTAQDMETFREEKTDAKSKAWKTDYNAMAHKTMVHQSLKMAPLSDEAERAAALEDQLLAGKQRLGQNFTEVEVLDHEEHD